MTDYAIRAEGIYKSFDGAAVLRGINLELPPKGAAVLMGASGCGKTTLLMILAGLLEPDKGTVKQAAGLRCSIVFQEDRLLDWATARRNVELVLRGTRGERSKAALRALESVGLGPDAERVVSELSGGMKRRVALARALSAEGGLLLLDEPFQGLDDEIKRTVAEVLKQASQSASVLMVTHDLREAEAIGADTVIRL